MQTDMATPPILKFGTDAQIEEYLVPAIKGTKVACLGISEPNVWVGLSRARVRFKKAFERRYGDFETAKGANHVTPGA